MSRMPMRAWTTSTAKQTSEVNLGGSKMAGKFEITKDKSGQYRFRLKASNGEIIATSESYKTKAAAKNGVKSLQKELARRDSGFDRTE